MSSAGFLVKFQTPAPSPTPWPLGGCPNPSGDADYDSTANIIDAELVLQYDAGLIASLPCRDPADVNEDGTINAIDAALILRFTAGLLVSLPP